MTFYGKNETESTAVLMSERAKYKLYLYYENDPKMIKNLTESEMNYYGKVSFPAPHSIVPREELLVPIGTDAFGSEGQKLVFPFIKDMFIEVKRNLEFNLAFKNMMNTNESISQLNPVRAYESPIEKYNQYLKRILTLFNAEFIPSYGKERVMNFNDYVKLLLKFMKEEIKNSPLTLSDFVLSKHNSIFGTGLAVSIQEGGYSSDLEKTEFARNSMFSYYSKLAMNKGFSILKNLPWCLVADLSSPAASRFIYSDSTSAIDDLDSFFTKYFIRTSNLDIDILKDNIINYYNLYITTNRTQRNIKVTCANKTYIESKNREYISQTDPKYRDSIQWIFFYLELRNAELGNPLQQKELLEIKKQIQKNNFILDTRITTGYIDTVFTPQYSLKDFSFDDVVRRESERNKALEQQRLKGSSQNTTTSGGSSGGSSGGY